MGVKIINLNFTGSKQQVIYNQVPAAMCPKKKGFTGEPSITGASSFLTRCECVAKKSDEWK
jgi:hypothetical protein